MKPIKPLLLSLFFSVATFAQTPTYTPLQRIKIAEFTITSGFNSDADNTLALESFRLLVPQSKIITINSISQNKSANYFSFSQGIPGSNMFNIHLGLKFADKKNDEYRVNPVLRIGICYASGIHFSSGFSDRISKPLDTLISTGTGQTIYLDSTTVSSTFANYSCDQLRLDASLIYRTNPQARFSLSAGIGFNYGLSLRAQSNVSYSEYTGIGIHVNVNANSNSSAIYSTSTNKSESWDNETNRVFCAFVPMGFDFSISKKRNFWKPIHLFYEFRPGIAITKVPELKTYHCTSLMQGIGLRIMVN